MFREYDYRLFDPCGEIEPADELIRLIDVTEDKDRASVVVTYPHIVERYKLSTEAPYNFKVGEWVTKYNLTSAVVYDATLDKYIGVFHEHTVRVWGHETSDLEQAEKYKFRIPVLRILRRRGKVPLILFRNGDCVTLPYGLEHCGSFGRRALVKESSTIVDAAAYTISGTDHVCYVVKDNNNLYTILTYPIIEEICDSSKIHTVTVANVRDTKREVKVTGQKISAASAINPVVYFVWSDSCVSIYDIIKRCWKHNLYRYIWDKFKSEVSITTIGKNYLFIYKKENADKATISVPHASMKACSQRWMMEPYAKTANAKLFNIDNFAVVADTTKITVWDVAHKENRRPPHWSNDDTTFLLKFLTEPFEYFPIFGYLDTSKKKKRRKHR